MHPAAYAVAFVRAEYRETRRLLRDELPADNIRIEGKFRFFDLLQLVQPIRTLELDTPLSGGQRDVLSIILKTAAPSV